MGISNINSVQKKIFNEIIKQNFVFMKLLSDEGYLNIQGELVRPIHDILFFLSDNGDRWITDFDYSLSNGYDPKIDLGNYDYEHIKDYINDDSINKTEFYNIFRLGDTYYQTMYYRRSYDGTYIDDIDCTFKVVRPNVDKLVTEFIDV